MYETTIEEQIIHSLRSAPFAANAVCVFLFLTGAGETKGVCITAYDFFNCANSYKYYSSKKPEKKLFAPSIAFHSQLKTKEKRQQSQVSGNQHF